MANFIHNVSDSAAPTGWYHVEWNAPVKKGDLVLLRMPIKRVWARAGDQVTFTPRGVYCQGPGCYAQGLIPNSKPESDIPQVCPYGTRTVPPDMFLGMGTNDPDSYDGRYLCFLPTSLIAGTVRPIWTNH
jgi:type IV secretory pathway protease TraF